jgi:hypothetical protein
MGLGGWLTAVIAGGGERVPLDGSSATVVIPHPYKPGTGRLAGEPGSGLICAYRNLSYRMSGTQECDGMIAVAPASGFASLQAFVSAARGRLTPQWSFANDTLDEWYGRPGETLPEVEESGRSGTERTGPLRVRRSGWFGVDDHKASLYAVDHTRGLKIAIWIFTRHGGVGRARRMSGAIAASCRPAS